MDGFEAGQANIHGLGGSLQTGVSNVDTCKQDCLAMPTCIALDFDATLSSCYFFETAGYTTEALSGVTHYVVTRCPG